MYNNFCFNHINNEVKRVRKYIILFLVVFMLAGCSINNGPREEVEKLLKKYQSLDSEVLDDLELDSEREMFSNKSIRDDYIKSIKKQYSDMKFEITDEEVNGNDSTVTVNINVYDYYKVQKEADAYYVLHQEEFTTNGVFDTTKLLSYKINKMMDTSERVEYTIKVNLKKEDNKWSVEKFDNNTLKKIHGTYNYENN